MREPDQNQTGRARWRFCLSWLVGILALATLWPQPSGAGKSDYLDLARKGWAYELRRTMIGRDMSIPTRIHGRTMSGIALCIVGDEPTVHTAAVLQAFADLMEHVHGKPMPMRYAGESTRYCGSRRTMILRLYSGFPPNARLTEDLERLNRDYALGLPSGRFHAATSPAMAQTFFGRRGAASHVMVAQSQSRDPLDLRFHRSILIEELFQVFTFGMDVAVFRRDYPFMSKLQEFPVDTRRMNWASPVFKRAILSANPNALCPFDIFMMHAVAQAPVAETTDPAFIAFIDAAFDGLERQTQATLSDPRFAVLLDTSCRPYRAEP